MYQEGDGFMMFRNFLYLDTKTMTDYLSTVMGYVPVLDNHASKVAASSHEHGAKITVPLGSLRGANQGSSQLSEVVQTTEAAQFHQLYEILHGQDMFRFLNYFDDVVWDQIRRGDLVEIPARVSLPKPFTMIQGIQGLSPMLEMMSSLGQDPFKNQNEAMAFQGLISLGEQISRQSVPIVFTAEYTQGYRFSCQLQRRFLRCDVSEIEGEADIFGKVQKVIPRGKEEEVFTIAESFSTIFSTMGREQRREFEKSSKKNGVSEVVKGPALIIAPLAVYR